MVVNLVHEADKIVFTKKKRKRISKPVGSNTSNNNRGGSQNNRGNNKGFKGRGNQRPAAKKEELTEEEIQKQVRETLEKLQGRSSKGKGAKYRRSKREAHREQSEAELEAQELESKINLIFSIQVMCSEKLA